MMFERFAWKVAHRYYNPKSIHGKEDLFQTAYVGLLEQLRRHPESSRVLCMQAMKSAIWHLYTKEMRGKRQAETVPWDQNNPEIKYLRAGDNTEATVIQLDTRRAIVEAVDMLPEDERHLFLLRANGANLSEEVRCNGWRHSTVKWKLLKARQRLQEWLTEAEITA